MYRFSANSRATISSTAIFLSQQSRQYFSSPRGSETSLALQSAQRVCATDLRGMPPLYQFGRAGRASAADVDQAAECTDDANTVVRVVRAFRGKNVSATSVAT